MSKDQCENRAAYLVSPKAPALEICSAPYTPPQSNEIVIRNHAIALNPVDFMIQSNGTSLMYSWLKYPVILGVDVAGEVVEVGSNVTKFRPGDRVIGQTLGSDKGRGEKQNPEAGFQLFTVLRQHMTCKIPGSMSYEDACVVPLGCSTAACGLFQKDQLGLELPQSRPQRKKLNKTVLIWGGSTSVGSNAIQLAKAAGYDVITTCSPSNFDFCQVLGAEKCFDYKSPTVTKDIIAYLKNKTCAGALSIGPGGADACIDILSHCTCDRKFVSMATYPMPDPAPQTLIIPRTILNYIGWNIRTWIRCKLRGIGWNFIFGSTLAENEVGPAIYESFLPDALAKGEYQAKPAPFVVGHGLENIQGGLDMLRKGVSAKKVVVTL